MSGHTPAVCSEVIRYTASGAGTAHHPASRPARPCRPTVTSNSSRSRGAAARRRSAGAGGGRSRPAADPLRGRRAPATRVGRHRWPPRRRGSPMPSGMHAATNPESWARSSRSGVNPAAVIEVSRRRAASAIDASASTVTAAAAATRTRALPSARRVSCPVMRSASRRCAARIRNPARARSWVVSSVDSCSRADDPVGAAAVDGFEEHRQAAPFPAVDGARTGARAPITAPLSGSSTVADRGPPRVVGVAARGRGSARRSARPRPSAAHQPLRCVVGGEVGRGEVAGVAGGVAGADRLRQRRAVQPCDGGGADPAEQGGLDLGHHRVQHPAAAVDAAAGLPGRTGDPGLRDDEGDERFVPHRCRGQHQVQLLARPPARPVGRRAQVGRRSRPRVAPRCPVWCAPAPRACR